MSEREELNGLVEKMTHSGSPSLDEVELKKLKRMCRCVFEAFKPARSDINSFPSGRQMATYVLPTT